MAKFGLSVLKMIYLVLSCAVVFVIVLQFTTLDVYVTETGIRSQFSNSSPFIRSPDKSSTHPFQNNVWSNICVHSDTLYKGGRLLSEKNLKDVKPLSLDHCRSQRFLVYKCDSSSRCGGWADRQKGIVSSFLLSLLTNRTFIVDVTSPCELNNILLSNAYNWSMCSTFLKTVRKENVSKFNYISGKEKEFLKQIKTFDFDRQWKKQVIVLRFNAYAIDSIRQHKQAKIRLKWLMNITNEEAIHLILHTLFKPNQKLLDDAKTFYNDRIQGRCLVCSHIRIGKNPSNPNDDKIPMGSPNETVILDFLERYDSDQKHVIYVASDSDESKRLAENRLKTYISINRTIDHVDRLGKIKKNAKEACEGFYSAVLEQLILSLCDTLILTRSGFGNMAAYIRGTSENLYLFHPKSKRILQSNLTNLQNVFRFL